MTVLTAEEFGVLLSFGSVASIGFGLVFGDTLRSE
jgi:Flp pilus assembly pilin Flp